MLVALSLHTASRVVLACTACGTSSVQHEGVHLGTSPLALYHTYGMEEYYRCMEYLAMGTHPHTGSTYEVL
jgi:hypothetical protein